MPSAFRKTVPANSVAHYPRSPFLVAPKCPPQGPTHSPRWAPRLKRSIDVVFAGIALIAGAPFLVAIALAVRLDSPGPVLYRSRRVGKSSRVFVCLKFRTMRPDADQLKEQLRIRNERKGPFFKMAADPRITRVGRFLRRYSLDELPQLWNVMRGEMSLVGPRPHPVDDCQRYHPEDFRRFEATPGLTGLWQVTARSDPSFQRCLALDLDYIEHWSLSLDIRILCRTIPEILQGGGI